MSYRVVRIANISYKGALDRLRRDHPDLDSMSYDESLKALFGLGMIYTDAFSQGMRALGVEAIEIIADADSIQKKWADEHGLRLPADDSWRALLVIAQIKHYRPDVVFFQDVHGLPRPFRQDLKSLCPSVRLTVLHKGYPGQFDEMADFDLVYMSMPSLVDLYRDRGIPAELHYHGFNGNIPDLMTSAGFTNGEKALDFSFIGSSGYGHGDGHRSRYWAMVRLFRETPMVAFTDEVFSQYGSRWARFQRALRNVPGPLIEAHRVIRRLPGGDQIGAIADDMKFEARRREVIGGSFSSEWAPPCPISAIFPDRCRRPVYGLDMYHALARSHVTFNLHADATGDSVGNLRMFEATGAGTCLLTDSGPNIRELFEPDTEVVTYASLDEGIEKVRYLLSHPETCREIAEAGQRRTLREHTVQMRVANVDALIRQRLARRGARAK